MPTVRSDDGEKQSAASRPIQFHANRGYLIADIDPLGLMQRPMPRVLELSYVGLTDADMEAEFYTGSRTAGVENQMKLREIFVQLRQIFAGRIGAEFAHVSEADGRLQPHFTKEEKLNLPWQLSAAEGIERYPHTKCVGQRRSLLEDGTP